MKKIAALLSLTILLIGCRAATQTTNLYVVSIPAAKLAPYLQDGKRITEYKIRLTTARVYGISKIADDWWIKIMPEIEQLQIEASAGHGASWLTLDDVLKGAFDKFITIEKDKEGGKLQIQADISIDIPSEEKEQHIRIEEKDMIIIPKKTNE